MQQPGRFDVLDVLLCAGAVRTAFLASLDVDDPDVDAQLVSDVLRSTGRVGAALDTRRALVELCALVRAIDAALQERIDLDELRRGLELHAARTDRFAAFHDARVLLRTLTEVLDGGRAAADGRAARAQVAFLHGELRAWLLEELTGSADGALDGAGALVEERAAAVVVTDPRAPWRVHDPARRREHHQLVTELFEGARHHPVTGLLGAAWVRGWSAVPVAGDQLGEDPAEPARLVEALPLVLEADTPLVQVDRQRPPRWTLRGGEVVVGDHLRASWSLPATQVGVAAAATFERRGWTVLTSRDLAFALVEGDAHHVVMGPSAFVTALCGAPPLEAMAAFRDHVESLAVDGEPPEDLLEVAARFGRLRRRRR